MTTVSTPHSVNQLTSRCRSAVKVLHVDRRRRHGVAAARTKHIGSPALELRLPRHDLIGVDVELLGKLRQCPIALDGSKRHLRLTWRGSGQGPYRANICGSPASVRYPSLSPIA